MITGSTTALRATTIEGAKLFGRASLPLYHQVQQDIRCRIDSNEFTPGAALPSEEEFCARYNVSRITVRRALDELTIQGLIQKRRGVGSFVADRKAKMQSVRLVGSLNEFLAMAGALNTQLISIASVLPPVEAREALGLMEGETATRVQILAVLESKPVGFLDIFVLDEVGSRINLAALKSGDVVIRRIERILGKRVVRAEQIISAGRAGVMAGHHLGLAHDAPALNVKRVYYDRSGIALEVVLVRYHPEHYQFSVEFLEQTARPV